MSTTSQDRHQNEAVRVLLADEHQLYAKTLETVLAPDARIDVVGWASSGAEAIALAGLRPAVVLMADHMPSVDGIEATRILRALLPGVRVVMLSSSPAVEDVERARDAGASGYLTKDADGGTIAGEVVRLCSMPHGPRTELRVA